mgnify:CR=1 FL=1
MMSATADAMKFSKYFAKPVEGVLVNAPIVSVDVTETHPVRVYHLDDLENLSVNFIRLRVRPLTHF